MALESTVTCLNCRTMTPETMPEDHCVVVYECRGCGETLRPKTGDCCVYCSYGSMPCPPAQAGQIPTLPTGLKGDQARSMFDSIRLWP